MPPPAGELLSRPPSLLTQVSLGCRCGLHRVELQQEGESPCVWERPLAVPLQRYLDEVVPTLRLD